MVDQSRDLPGIAAAEMPVWATGRVPGHGPFQLNRSTN